MGDRISHHSRVSGAVRHGPARDHTVRAHNAREGHARADTPQVAAAGGGTVGRRFGRVASVRVFPSQSTHDAGKGARLATLGASRRVATAGVLVVPRTVGGQVITRAEMQQAVAALRSLPAADIALIARQGIQIHLFPVQGLEDNLLGATTIVQDDTRGPWRPTMIRIAARAGLTGSQSLGEIVQHEFGHAVMVLRSQDRSEAAASAYARRY